MNLYPLLKPLLFTLPPEAAHQLAITWLRHMPKPAFQPVVAQLQQQVAGLIFPNPIGMAAGFDKQAEVIEALLARGFGFVETGTVTPKAQPGNPRPRMFRLVEDQAVINRLGFNSEGVEAYLEELSKPRNYPGIVGANIGKNKTTENAIDDYVYLLEKVYGKSHYITVNISSPNTPGLRLLQKEEALQGLIKAVTVKRNSLAEASNNYVPLWVKIAPDITDDECRVIIDILLEHNIDGVIIANTTISRKNLVSCYAGEDGGLSGRPLFAMSTELVRRVYVRTEGKLPIIGVGGIASPEDVYQKLCAGASLVQIYTGFIYQGLGLVKASCDYLYQKIEEHKVNSVSELVGSRAQ